MPLRVLGTLLSNTGGLRPMKFQDNCRFTWTTRQLHAMLSGNINDDEAIVSSSGRWYQLKCDRQTLHHPSMRQVGRHAIGLVFIRVDV